MADPTTTPSRPDAEAPGYEPATVERKWQARWAANRTNSPDLARGEKPFYQLMMFPYPSAEGLHIGNLYAFTGNDIHGRFQRLQGHTVFEPIGYDAFGIHSENYALKVGVHPSELIPRNIENFRRQLHRAGLMVDWSHELSTTDRAYYKWTQWIFLQLYHRGLAYKKRAAVNWCPSCKTVLSNEQVEGGFCERCGSKVEQRQLEQWFFRITDYAPRLLANLETIDWSETTRTAQRNWIGASQGARVGFRVVDDGDRTDDITVFTTRPDTIFGATYLVLAPEHPLVDVITRPEQRAAVQQYRERTARQDIISRKTNKEKTGAFTGATAINPATGSAIPVWIADYVLMEYGTGAIMAVPGHDERDFEFATAFALPIVRVVAGPDATAAAPLEVAETETAGARIVNSGDFDGLSVDDANARIVGWLAERGAAEPVTTYRLHDWCISRQRYWGPPIPIIYCESCGTVPVPEKDLPVELPYVEDVRPDDSGISPLARHEEWYHVACPQCGKQARRETDVSDTFLDSAWYFLRYPSSDRDDVPFDAALTRKWLPVSSYIGGNEHAVLHLLYSRFVTMVLHDAGLVHFEEPFTKFRAHGLIIREGAKMSKSRGNVVNPDQYMDDWGADTVRTYLMFLGPFEEGGDFRDRSISGVRRFLDRVWASVHDARTDGAADADVMRKLHQTIAKVGDDVAKLSYNTAIAAMMEYVNVLRAHERVPHRAEVEPLVQLLSPFAPHVAEELWETLGHTGSIFDSRWPAFDAALAAENTVKLAVQVNGKLRGTVDAAKDADQGTAMSLAMADPAVAKFVTGAPKKVIFVPGRLLNIVV
ncbi:MAG: leucine--tRNA ligase [Gemmatimonadaceae bacterium]|nr:leucine--tRNA ligase [Gemmatimonadaceae bacterium]NUQ92310.1 leucine--tRNA ligase [Gemmatimonadaceae bacterium]NUR19715.1 leucine--tRNA ligase [Gemmatimonadaceae bacterium]NUS98718.1 leucine--tRNA ligase [Gemmatimonadaceae bacterium]